MTSRGKDIRLFSRYDGDQGVRREVTMGVRFMSSVTSSSVRVCRDFQILRDGMRDFEYTLFDDAKGEKGAKCISNFPYK
jgi:hypothetical protein